MWKPGAEKICGMLGLIPRFPNLAEYEKAALGAVDVKVIILKCELHTGNGFVAAEGTGARRVDQDRGDINKSLKMAVKSAHIDATLRVAGLSELFTQDIEDMLQDKAGKGDVPAGDANNNHPSPPAQPQPAPTPPPPPRVPATNGQNGGTKSPANNGQNQTTNGQSYESNRITSKQHSLHHGPAEGCPHDQDRAESALRRGLRLRGRSHHPPRCIQPHRLAPQPVIHPVNSTRGKMP